MARIEFPLLLLHIKEDKAKDKAKGGADSVAKKLAKSRTGSSTESSGEAAHELDKKFVESIDPFILDVLTGKKNIPITHLVNSNYSSLPIKFNKNHRLLDLNKTKKYIRRSNEYKPALHWGQLKLFLSEVEFLTLAIKECPDKELWFVYAGAAPGHHIKYLATLFPKIHFELYDPNDFVVKDTDMIKTHVQFFTDEDAKFWANSGKTVVFCSDIRSEPATQENIIRNMKMQLDWWKIINPELSMFKFRLPWESGKTEYPEGDIYIQAFAGPTSSETRLICKKDAKLIEYDNTTYEDACFNHNTDDRLRRYQTALGNIQLIRDGLDMCYDCSSFIYIMHEYMKIMNLSFSGIRKLISMVQSRISFGQHNILARSIQNCSNSLNVLSRSCYVQCNKTECDVCMAGQYRSDPTAKGMSKATIENEIEQLKKINVLSDKDLDDL